MSNTNTIPMKHLLEKRIKIALVGTYLFGSGVLYPQTQEDVHQFFERQAAKLNAERAKHSTPEIEIIKVDYDRRLSTLSYTYRGDLAKSRNKMSSKDELMVMKATLVNSACNGTLAPFMRQHNLRLTHTYFSKETNQHIHTFEVTKRDC